MTAACQQVLFTTKVNQCWHTYTMSIQQTQNICITFKQRWNNVGEITEGLKVKRSPAIRVTEIYDLQTLINVNCRGIVEASAS